MFYVNTLYNETAALADSGAILHSVKTVICKLLHQKMTTFYHICKNIMSHSQVKEEEEEGGIAEIYGPRTVLSERLPSQIRNLPKPFVSVR